MTAPNRHSARREPQARGAFTLVELIVAIGAVLLVTLGVGQIFAAVSRLTSFGRASAEIDSAARLIEQRLREDFDGFRRMAPEDTFLAIRMREIGDFSRDGDALDAGERPVYLTSEDQQEDQRNGLLPYEILNSGGANEIRSRAVTSRLDEIVFLARAPEGRPYASQQIDLDPGAGPVTAQVARIYWGHALRPVFDAEYDPQNGSDDHALRQYTPDGDFGMPADPGELFTPGDPDTQPFIPRGRNRYAGEWMLVRQPLLLYGGLAAGHAGPNNDPAPPFAIGANREFAPYINDLETLRRYKARGSSNDEFRLNPPDTLPILFDTRWPDPRLISWGRVDICAQDERDVRRWFERQAYYDSTINPPMRYPAAAGAFSAGFDSAVDYVMQSPSDVSGFFEVNGPLGARETLRSLNSTFAEDVMLWNLRSLRSAIAGSFSRILADDALAPVRRMPDNTDRVQPEDAAMDLHAVISSHCSNFEVAWSDGRRAIREIDFDGDGLDEIAPGDLIWFDISPARPPAAPGNPFPAFNSLRHTFANWRAFEIDEGRPQTDSDFWYTDQRPRSEVPGGVMALPDESGLWGTGNLLLHAQNHRPETLPPGVYSTAITGGERDASDPVGNAGREPNELLAIWGFRLPTADGGYGAPWPKPAYIRVRVTLHDSQFRIPGGKSYEFVFSLRPDSSS